MSKLEFYLNKIIHYGLYAILLAPLAFWPKALYPFATPKFLLFQILVEIVFGAWIILKFLKPNFRSPTSVARAEEVGLQELKLGFRNWLVIALVLFIAISFISALFGVDFSRSFWGLGARMTGLFAELHFLAWFLVLISVSKFNFRSPTSVARAEEVGLQELKLNFNITRYINFSFAISILVALSAFYQNLGWTMTLGSTLFNNPTFVAPYFIFHFFWGLYQTLNLKSQISNLKKLWRWVYAAGTVLLFVVIILTQIRGAIFGLLIGIFAFGLLLIFSNMLNQRLRNILIVIYLIFAIGIAGLWSFRDLPLIQNISILEKITTASLAETTVRTRLLTWQLALKGFWDKPVLGVGPENFNYVFNAHYNPALLKYGTGETWFDKPHNAFLEILTETGIIGGLAYLLILVAVAWTLLKLWRKGEKILAGALLGGFLGYLGSIFFSFDSFGSWFGLYLMLGFLVSHNSNTNDTNKHTNDANGNFLKNIFVLFVCGVLFVLLYVNYGIWRANIADADALRIFPKDPEQGIGLFKKSLNYFTPYKAEYQFDLIASVIGAMQKNIPLPDLENTLNFALDGANKALAAHPKNAAYYSDIAKLYGILGGMGRDPAILAQSEEFGKKALELSPKRQETLFYLAQTALLRGDTKLAIEWTKQAVQVEPAIKQSHWYLGRLYIASGKNEEGISEIKKALELGYQPQNETEKIFIKNLGL